MKPLKFNPQPESNRQPAWKKALYVIALIIALLAITAIKQNGRRQIKENTYQQFEQQNKEELHNLIQKQLEQNRK